METPIQFDNVVKQYGKIQALNGLSLTVLPGEIYGFIGPNGAGKSTAIRLLLNFIQAQQGTVKVLGLDPERDEITIKSRVGYVSSESFMYPDMRVSELFAFVKHYHQVKSDAKLRKVIDALEIQTGKRFEELSFGNRKKVAIACAMVHEPELLILDEPSNGLDPVIRANLYELLVDEQKRGATVFFSSHVLTEVQKVCTKIGLIKEGKLIREAKAAEFTNLGYRKVSVQVQQEFDVEHFPGVAGVKREHGQVTFMYSGKPDDLIRMLGTVSIDAIHIEEPDLEHVFMHYFNHKN